MRQGIPRRQQGHRRRSLPLRNVPTLGRRPLLAIDCGTQVTISNEDFVSRCSASEWAERGFCKTCGTHLFYHFKPANRTPMLTEAQVMEKFGQ